MTVRPLLLLALAACDPFAPSAPPPPPAEPAPPPAPAPPVRSCPAASRPVPVTFTPRFTVGDHAGVTWLYGHTAHGPALAHLGADDRLALTPVPLQDATAGALDGPRLRLISADARWLSVDLGAPERPVVGPVTPLTGLPAGRPTHLAVGPRRALALLASPAQQELVLLDPATDTSVAPSHPLPVTFRPLHAACGADGCAIVAIDHAPEIGVHDNHLVVVRVAPDGAREHERLTADPFGEPRVAPLGDRLVAAWPTADGVRLRALSRDGVLLGPSVPVPWDSKSLQDLRLFAADDALVLAVRELDGWSAALVGPHGNAGPRHTLPGADRRHLFAAPLRDGLAWVVVGDAVDHERPGAGVMTDAWQVEADAGFLPTAGAPPPVTTLAESDDLAPFLLTRPGAAAALLVARAGFDRAATTTLAHLRTTCPSTPSAPPAADALAVTDESCREAP